MNGAVGWGRVGWLVMMLGLALGASSVAAQDQEMTLDEAVDRALQRSPQLAQSQQALENAGWARRTTVGSFLPTLSSSSSMSIRSATQRDPDTGELRSGSSDSYGAGLSVSYDIFSGFSRFRDLDGTAADLNAAEARLVDQRYAVVLQTQNAFFQALRQEELVAVAQARVAQADASLGLTRTRADLRVATVSDTLRARLEFVNARQALLQAEANLRTARVNLGRQVGVPVSVAPVTPDGLEPAPLALDDEELVAMAVNSSPSVLAAEASASAAQASARASRSSYYPSVRMSSGYNWSNQDPSFTGGSTSWNWGLSASLPLFNGFNREATVGRADQTLRVARMQEDDSRLAARAEVVAALESLRTAEQAILIAQEAVAVAEEDLRVIQERYAQGVARIFDVVQSQVSLDQARVDLVGARYDYVLARAELEAIVGRPL